MADVFDCSHPPTLLTGSRRARQALAQGELVVLPTDTVYGIAADAFSPDAVARLLAAKGRGRTAPPPVLVATIEAIGALAAAVPTPIAELAAALWPGPLTIVLQAQPSLSWDLGDTAGTVALRIPDHELTRALLAETGPLAVSSANLTGRPAATTAAEASDMLGDSVDVILDAGTSPGGVASTIIDATTITESGGTVRVLREGAISIEELVGAASEALTFVRVEQEQGAQPTETQDGAPAPESAEAAELAPAETDAPDTNESGTSD